MDLVPNIAFGDLGQSSLAEVVAAGFRALATGTVSIEQGKGESRLFFRYGIPCGALLFQGFRPFTYALIDQGVLDAKEAEGLLAQASKERRLIGELLIEQGRLTPERAIELVTAHHRELLSTLCLLREGKYELRGWERPPDWTEPIVLDPFQTIAAAFAADELFDRRRAIQDQIGPGKLRLAEDFNDQAGRLLLTPKELDAFARLSTPRGFGEFADSLEREDADSFVVSAALLGLIDVQGTASVVAAPVIEDPTSFLRPLEPTMPPQARTPASALLVVEPAVFDEASLLRPIEASTPPRAAQRREAAAYLAPLGAPAFDSTLPPPAQAQRGSRPDASPFSPSSGDFPSAREPTPADISDIGFEAALDRYAPPAMRLHAPMFSGGEIEFEPNGEDEPLELDIQRAPLAMRAQLEPAMRATPSRSIAPPRPPPPQGRRQDSGSRPAVSPSIPGSSKTVSVLAQRPAARASEYNPFSIHFRRAESPIPEALDALDARLDRALRGEAAPKRSEPPAATAPSPEDELEAALHRLSPAVPVPAALAAPTSGPVDILADIAETVGDLHEDRTGPISIDEPVRPRPESDDDLALLAAEEVSRVGTDDDALAADEVVEDTVFEDAVSDSAHSSIETEALVEEPEPTPFPIEAAGEEDVAEQPVTPVATAALPVAEEKPGPVSESAQDVRRRLLQRAFRNVAGSFGSREPHHQPGLQRPEATPLRPDAADAELEKDVSNRLMRMPAQDQFSRLDLERTATTEQVKDAFLSLAKRYHPDRITALGQNHLLPQGRELFARVKEAYDVLVDPASRARYVTELNEKDGSKSKLTPAEARTAYQQGLHHFRRRDFSKAEAEFVRAIAGEPLGDYMAELAYTLLMNPARYEDSRTEIKDLIVRALKSGNETDRTYVIAAHIARKDGENDKAEKFFRRAVEKNPKNIEAARELRLLDMRRGSGSGGKSGTGLFDRLRSKPKPPVNGKEK